MFSKIIDHHFEKEIGRVYGNSSGQRNIFFLVKWLVTFGIVHDWVDDVRMSNA